MRKTRIQSLGWIPWLGRSTGEGTGNPLQYSCLKKSRGHWSLVGYSPYGHKESDMTEQHHFIYHFSLNIFTKNYLISSVQFSYSVVSDTLPLKDWRCPCPSPTPRACFKLMSIKSVMISNHISLWHPLLLLLSIFPASRSLPMSPFFCIRWPKYWSFNLIISPSNEYSGLISFRIGWLNLLAVQRTLKSLLHHSSKASILWCSAFFMVQHSHPCMITGKT